MSISILRKNHFLYNIPCIALLCVFVVHEQKRNDYRNLERIHIQYLKELKKEHGEIKKLNHDLKNELLVYRGYLMSGRVREVISMIDTSLLISEGINELKYTDYLEIDSVISYKRQQAINQQIEFNVDISHLSLESVNLSDLSLVLAISLDNAIEGALRAQGHRYLHLKIVRVGNMLFIHIRNSSVKEKIDFTRTSKCHLTMHGLGIIKIKEIIRKYNGELSLRQKENEVITSIRINL